MIRIQDLKSDKKRKKIIQSILANLDLQHTVTEAIHGNSLSTEEINHLYNSEGSIREMKRELKPSEIGCALSHISIYKKIIENNVQAAIILEDDTIIDKEIYAVEEIIESLPDKWDLLLLGHSDTPNGIQSTCKTWIQKNILNNYSIAKPLTTVGGAYGYAITAKGAEKLLNATKTLHRTIDNYTGDHTTVDLYAIYPNIVRVNFKLGSSIQKDREQAIKNLKSISYQARSKLKNKSSLYRKLSQLNKKRREMRKWSSLCLLRITRYKIEHFLLQHLNYK